MVRRERKSASTPLSQWERGTQVGHGFMDFHITQLLLLKHLSRGFQFCVYGALYPYACHSASIGAAPHPLQCGRQLGVHRGDTLWHPHQNDPKCT